MIQKENTSVNIGKIRVFNPENYFFKGLSPSKASYKE